MAITSKIITLEIFEDECPKCHKVFTERYKKSLENNMPLHIEACKNKEKISLWGIKKSIIKKNKKEGDIKK